MRTYCSRTGVYFFDCLPFTTGAYDGIKFYMVPDWDRLSDIKVWEAAAVQVQINANSFYLHIGCANSTYASERGSKEAQRLRTLSTMFMQ